MNTLTRPYRGFPATDDIGRSVPLVVFRARKSDGSKTSLIQSKIRSRRVRPHASFAGSRP